MRRVPLARYWTLRYLAALIIGLLIVSILSITWLRHNTMTNRIDMLEVVADEMSSRITESITNKEADPSLFRERTPLSNLGINPKIYLTNSTGGIISSNEPKEIPQKANEAQPDLPKPPDALFTTTLPMKVIESKKDIVNFHLKKNNTTYYAVKKAITNNEDNVVGYIVLLESKKNIAHVDQEYTQLAAIIIALALIGTVAIHLLSRRLSKPIKDVAQAAQQIQNGDYNVALANDVKEQEVYELIESFREMANRLKQLEATRTELLAGVTHELKTPVTSISGLLQAVKDGVVTGDDEKEFVKMALNETTKLKTMVGDLLAFNSFSVNAIPVHIQPYAINHYVQESVMQWVMSQQDDGVKVAVEILPEEQILQLDGVRFQQILTNLLTNAKQAMDGHGHIQLTLQEENDNVAIFIADTGKGIPQEEQAFVFERFYRGENKKYAVRGLGLGLALSKMMAQSLKGDLQLLESTTNGTVFKITLPKAVEQTSE
nr:HAMP domain-containing sensor histidine kinase [Kurthia huakuii]